MQLIGIIPLLSSCISAIFNILFLLLLTDTLVPISAQLFVVVFLNDADDYARQATFIFLQNIFYCAHGKML